MCQEAAVNHMQGLPMITVIQQSLLGHYKARQQVKTANLTPAIKGTEGKGTINGPADAYFISICCAGDWIWER